MMPCPWCQKEIDEVSDFCMYCGRKVKANKAILEKSEQEIRAMYPDVGVKSLVELIKEGAKKDQEWLQNLLKQLKELGEKIKKPWLCSYCQKRYASGGSPFLIAPGSPEDKARRSDGWED